MKDFKKTKRLLLLLFLTSCGLNLETKHEIPKAPSESLSARTLDYATLQARIFTPRCIQCHQQLNSYAGVKREIRAIEDTVGKNRMPKFGPELPRELKTLLSQWIVAGTPELEGAPPATESPEVLEPNWKSISANVVYPKCLACHNPSGEAKFLDLSSLAAVRANQNRVFAGGKRLIDVANPEQSYFLEVILDPNEPMPPKWSNIAPLDQATVRILTEWIALDLP